MAGESCWKIWMINSATLLWNKTGTLVLAARVDLLLSATVGESRWSASRERSRSRTVTCPQKTERI